MLVNRTTFGLRLNPVTDWLPVEAGCVIVPIETLAPFRAMYKTAPSTVASVPGASRRAVRD